MPSSTNRPHSKRAKSKWRPDGAHAAMQSRFWSVRKKVKIPEESWSPPLLLISSHPSAAMLGSAAHVITGRPSSGTADGAESITPPRSVWEGQVSDLGLVLLRSGLWPRAGSFIKIQFRISKSTGPKQSSGKTTHTTHTFVFGFFFFLKKRLLNHDIF